MSQTDHDNLLADEHSEVPPPLDSAADVKEVDYLRAILDGSIAWTVKEQGRRRAPNTESVWRHQMGLAGEIAVGSMLGVRANWETYDDYVGDDGYDLDYRGHAVEVKSVSRQGKLELRVPRDQLQRADYFVLTRVTHPLHMVEIIGWIRARELACLGERSPYDELVRVGPRCLNQFDTGRGPISPEQIRTVQSL